MSLSSKPAKSFAVGFMALTVLLTACGSSNGYSTKNPVKAISSASLSPSPMSNSENIASPPLNSRLVLKCSKNLAAAKQNILDKSTPVLNHYVGNVWLNSDLGIAILEAEYIVEDPSCEREATAMSLVEAISYGKKIKSVGENRLERSMQTSVDLLKNH